MEQRERGAGKKEMLHCKRMETTSPFAAVVGLLLPLLCNPMGRLRATPRGGVTCHPPPAPYALIRPSTITARPQLCHQSCAPPHQTQSPSHSGTRNGPGHRGRGGVSVTESPRSLLSYPTCMFPGYWQYNEKGLYCLPP
jgi:hypothetical protein